MTTMAEAINNSWYAINRQSAPNEAEIRIYDAIGMQGGTTAQQFIRDLKGINAKRIHVRLNTPGGECFNAIAIYNALSAHPAEIVVHVDGVAASAGSYIAMAGDQVCMASNAFLMVHNAHGGAMGEGADLRKHGDWLDMISDAIADAYAKRTKKDRKYWRGVMAEETWFTAEQAKEAGLCDVIENGGEALAHAASAFDFTAYNLAKIPDALKPQTNQPDPPAATEVVAPVAEVPQQETTAMAETSNASTAQAPAAVASGNDQGAVQPIPNTVQALNAQTIEVTKRQGIAEGRRAEREDSKTRLRDLIAAAPGKPDIAIRAFLSDETAASVKLAFDAAAEADRNANARIAAIELENARLIALAANGGYPNGIGMSVTNGDESDKMLVPAGTDPDTQAKMEWDSNYKGCRNSGATEKQYKLARVAALNGLARSFVAAGVKHA